MGDFQGICIGTEINLEMAYKEALPLSKGLGRKGHHTSLLMIKFDLPRVGDD